MLPSALVAIKEKSSQRRAVEEWLVNMTRKAYFFLTEPSSSIWSFVWGNYMAFVVLLIAVFHVLATCDGPNHYTGRKDMSSYPNLPNEATYRIVDIVLWSNLCLDTLLRSMMLLGMFLLPDMAPIADDFLCEPFKVVLNIFDFLSIVPFLVRVTYLNPDDIDINQFAALALQACYLLSFSKIMRVTKDMDAVLAVRLALGKSAKHLVIPLFFFLVFNIFFGVLLYFLEPCYNVDECAWKNLFEACFFCVVTMTTTGYGNQVPQYLPARAVSSVIMIFGVLFISMPLAIIGNEYENAWAELKERLRMAELEDIADDVSAKLDTISENEAEAVTSTSTRKSILPTTDSDFFRKRKLLKKSFSSLKVEKEAVRLANETIMSPLMDSKEKLGHALGELSKILSTSKKMNPTLLLLMCELRGWMAPLKWNIKQCMSELVGENLTIENQRKLSFFRSVNGFVDANDEINVRKGSKVSPDGTKRASNEADNDDSAIDEEKCDDSKAEESSNCNHKIEIEGKIVDPRTDKSEASHPPEPVEEKNLSFSPTNKDRRVFTAMRSVAALSNSKQNDKRKSLIEDALSTGGRPKLQRGIHSFAIKMVKAAPDIEKKGSDHDFTRNMERALDNPESIRTRLWMLLEFPHSSNGARILQLFLLFLILLSVFMLYTQTVPSFGSYGESADICGEVLRVYCPNKHDSTLDPGCFVHDANGPTASMLRFGCDDSDCFGHGFNFGAVHSNVTCVDDNQPFETAEQLAQNFKVPDFLVSRDDMHKLHDVCLRIECLAVEGGVNGNFVWIPVEIFINACFTIEILLRILVADSLYYFIVDFMNIFDIASVMPFYADVIQAMFYATPLDFRILSSSPAPVLLVAVKSVKVFRLFKMTRHFSASKVLFDATKKALNQILGIMSLLLFLVLMFALFVFEVEKGTPCYVGDDDCDIPDGKAYEYKIGQRVLINKDGDISQFRTVLDSLWFSIVTLTSVGYGDLCPITNLGQLISIVLMLFGAFYLAMPLTVAAATFWSVHQAYVEGTKKKKEKEKKSLVDAKFARKITSLENSLTNVTCMLDKLFDDIQSPTNAEVSSNKTSLLQRCLQIESALRHALSKHDQDIRKLSIFLVSNIDQRKKSS